MERFGDGPFLAEILMVSFNFAPKGWALCNGQLLPINQNQALFSLLGTTYGGNGQTNFALPDLRGRAPIHKSSAHPLGERGGAQAHTLTIAELPTHTHSLNSDSLMPFVGGTANSADPDGNYFASQAGLTTRFSKRPDDLAKANALTSTSVGALQAHLNMMPSLTINFIISLQGIFPSPN